MTKSRIKTGAGIILAVFAVMYSAFCAAANYFAFVLCGEADSTGVAGDTLRLAAVIMAVAAASFVAFALCWNVRAHRGWREKTSARMFGWLCANAFITFWVPPALTWNTSNLFTQKLTFMGFVPVLTPVVMMLAAAVVMLDIIKEKNGGTLRKRR